MSTTPKSKEELLHLAVELFKKEFDGRLPTHAGCGPGRVNLIGEHTDYNDGYVLPMALPNVTLVVGAKNGLSNITLFSAGVPESENKITLPVPAIRALERGKPAWANYMKGVITFFPGVTVPGFDAVIVSTVPLGGGVSSSAALEVATFTFLEALTGTQVDKREKALLCQKAEHVFAEMPCGIMDQYMSIFGEEGNALLLDCQSLTHEQVPFGDANVCVLITNSNFKHKLDGSEYPLRRGQCQEAVKLMGVKSLREASTHLLEKFRSKMDDGMFRRARHVVSEISRTYEAAQALRLKDYASFGCLMLQSHSSLRDDFEVSTPELDELVNIAMSCKGVYGSRLTGAGFGGSTVTLVNSEDVNGLIESLKKSSLKKLDFYLATPSKGAQNLTPVLQNLLKKKSSSNKVSTMTQTKSLVK